MEDLFYREQKVYDNAVKRAAELQKGVLYDGNEYNCLVKEYGRLLKQLRRITKISDRTTDNLNSSKLDLLDKVYYDTLTGVYNRRFLDENMKRILKSIFRSNGMLSVMMIDVDFFKKYNDTYGHDIGDVCLKSVAEALARSLTHDGDFVARYGGEEFIVVLPNTVERGAHAMASRILEEVRKLRIPHESSDVAKYVTVSIGVTTDRVKYGQNASDYIKRADEALYRSKNNGRDRYTFIK